MYKGLLKGTHQVFLLAKMSKLSVREYALKNYGTNESWNTEE